MRTRVQPLPWTSERVALLPRRGVYEPGVLWSNHTRRPTVDPDFRRAFKTAGESVGGGVDYLFWDVHVALWAAEHCVDLDGAFIEYGAGQRLAAAAICEHLGWGDRPFYLYDPGADAATFTGWPGVTLVEVPNRLVEHGPVAFLHVDMNHPEAAVRHFWPQLVTGGVLLLDDGFPTFAASRDSFDRLAAEIGFAILTLPTGQGLVVK